MDDQLALNPEFQSMAALGVKSAPMNFDPIEASREIQTLVEERCEREGRPVHAHPNMAETVGELLATVGDNVRAMQHELVELENMLPWKHWKDYHVDMDGGLEQLGETAVLEMIFECIDIHHFLNNIYLRLGVDTRLMNDFYYTKYLENLRRQREGY